MSPLEFTPYYNIGGEIDWIETYDLIYSCRNCGWLGGISVTPEFMEYAQRRGMWRDSMWYLSDKWVGMCERHPEMIRYRCPTNIHHEYKEGLTDKENIKGKGD